MTSIGEELRSAVGNRALDSATVLIGELRSASDGQRNSLSMSVNERIDRIPEEQSVCHPK